MQHVISQLECPITHELPIDPVVAEDGVVYERHAIIAHNKRGGVSAVTNKPVGKRLISVPHVTHILNLVVGQHDDARVSKYIAKRQLRQCLVHVAECRKRGTTRTCATCIHFTETMKQRFCKELPALQSASGDDCDIFVWLRKHDVRVLVQGNTTQMAARAV